MLFRSNDTATTEIYTCLDTLSLHDALQISTDHGVTWKPAKVDAPPNRFAWQRFTASVDLPTAGYYEVWSRATDSKGVTQPFAATNWNPQGYGGNPINYISVLVES